MPKKEGSGNLVQSLDINTQLLNGNCNIILCIVFFRDQIKYLNEMRHKNNLMYVILLCMYYKRRTVIYSYILDKVKVEEVVQDIFCQNAIISGDE